MKSPAPEGVREGQENAGKRVATEIRKPAASANVIHPNSPIAPVSAIMQNQFHIFKIAAEAGVDGIEHIGKMRSGAHALDPMPIRAEELFQREVPHKKTVRHRSAIGLHDKKNTPVPTKSEWGNDLPPGRRFCLFRIL
ncbi:MAG TPA: hypothetical protein VGO59_00155 [Verrucomicrobiae bacterium]